MKSTYFRTMFGLLLAFFILIPGAVSLAQTQLDCAGDDVMAVYFDNGDINANVDQFIQFNIHFALLNQTDCLEGIEFSWTNSNPGGFFLLSTTIDNNGINFGTHPEYIIGFQSPIPPVGNAAHFMTISALVVDTQPVEFSSVQPRSPQFPARWSTPAV